jgi:4-alpha-glucanotransferase
MLVAMEPLAGRAKQARQTATVDFERVGPERDARLRAAFAEFESLPKRAQGSLDTFRAKNAAWLDDFSLFRALKHVHGEASWTTWPPRLRAREPRAIASAERDLRREMTYHAFVQHQFANQWQALRTEATANGIGLIGDLPLYLAHDSADVWSQPSLFELDRRGMPTAVAGVPPDYFSATGQRWGNPLYRWKRHERDGFAWWVRRLKSALDRFDAVRLDHFIGFRRYWEIEAGCPTAVNGAWRPGPGSGLFKALQRGLLGGTTPRKRLPFIAEDLGVAGADVLALRDEWKLPGTRVLQFAFGDDPAADSFLPHNYRRRAVVYTGTHDNDTTVGWFHGSPAASTRSRAAIAREQRAALRYLGASDDEDIHWRFVRAASASVADLAIFPLQDVLGLDSRARMNRPGTTDGNWAWRADESSLSKAVADRLGELTTAYGRAPRDSAP